MRILAIETSCDETSAAILEKNKKDERVKILSNIILSSLPLHSKTGGIIPETAAREQIKFIIPVIEEALKKAKIGKDSKGFPLIDKIAVTIGPGLIGSLLVGVETAKTLGYIWEKPIIPINHLHGHIFANWIETKEKNKLEYPIISLVVSGGHTDLLLINKNLRITWIGGTRDDAAGEAFDKVGRILNLPYPGGPHIEKAAKKGDEKSYIFPRPMIGSDNFDFSFSGLKTAVARSVINKKFTEEEISNIAASFQKSLIDVLVKKTLKAAKKYKAKRIMVSGGVSANEKLREEMKKQNEKEKIVANVIFPPKFLTTDNAAMIGAAAFYIGEEEDWKNINANPELYFD